LAVIIGREAFQGPDRHRLEFLPQQAGALAVKLMLAHTTADARKGTFLTDLIESPGKIALRHQAYELFDINVQRARFNASRILALQASECLNLDLLERKPQCDLLGTTQANVWGKEWQGLTRRFGVQLYPGFAFGRLCHGLLRFLCVQDNPPSIGVGFHS
jgi:hypothetical protein